MIYVLSYISSINVAKLNLFTRYTLGHFILRLRFSTIYYLKKLL